MLGFDALGGLAIGQAAQATTTTAVIVAQLAGFSLAGQDAQFQPNNSSLLAAPAAFVLSGKNTIFASTSFPQSNDACIRIAGTGLLRVYGIGYYGGGNGLFLLDQTTGQWRLVPVHGAGQFIDSTSCMIDGVPNQAMAPSTRYYVYAKKTSSASPFVEIDHSTAIPQPGDPLGATIVSGYMFKNDGTRNQRLIGAVETDPSGIIWNAGTRGVYFSGVASYYFRQALNYHVKPSGGHGSTSWQEINSNIYVGAFHWGDGAEASMTWAGSVQSNTAGAVVELGVSINGENPPYDSVSVTCHVANKPEPFTVEVTCGDLPDMLAYYEFWMKNSSGNGTVVKSTAALHLTQ